MTATTEHNEHVAFSLAEVGGGWRVTQTEASGDVTSFDPYSWGAFVRGSLVVRAVKIPRTFRVGGDLCRDGYLVFDGKLRVISSASFNRDYQPLRVKAAA